MSDTELWNRASTSNSTREAIHHLSQMADDVEALNITSDLIDSIYLEANSLSETSLHAEHFLSQRGISREGRDARYRERLIKVLRDVDDTASKRITALNLATARNELNGIELDELYEGAAVQLQAAILKVFFTPRKLKHMYGSKKFMRAAPNKSN